MNIDILFFILSLVAFFLVFIPFPWHVNARNTGTCLFMAWIGLACLIFSINSFLWRDRDSNFAPPWCDISSKLLVGASASISTVSLCINVRLWFIATDRVRILEKRSVFILELVLGLGVPILEMGLQFIVQGRRFDIYQGIGCRSATDNVLLAYLLLQAPRLLIGTVSIVFCILTLIAYHRLYKFMHDTQPSPMFHQRTTLSVSFLWFLTLGAVAALFSVGYAGFSVYLNATAPSLLTSTKTHTNSFTLWMSWDDMHATLSSVNTYSSAQWRSDMMTELLLELDRWIFVGLAFLFFLFFGFTSEARRQYRMFFGCWGRRFNVDEDVDRGIGFQSGDLESAGSSTTMMSKPLNSSVSASTLDLKATISKPRPVGLSLPSQDESGHLFHIDIDNPYPLHSGSSDETTNKTIKVTAPSPNAHPHPNPRSFHLPSERPPTSSTSSPASSSWPPSALAIPNSGLSSASLYSQDPVRDGVASPSASTLPTPPSSSSGLHAQGTSASLEHEMQQPVNVQRRRSQSSGRKRSPARARSLSRSATLPPNGPLPAPPPSEVPPTPNSMMSTFEQRGRPAELSNVAQNVLASHGRTRSPSKDRRRIAVDFGRPF